MPESDHFKILLGGWRSAEKQKDVFTKPDYKLEALKDAVTARIWNFWYRACNVLNAEDGFLFVKL
jgi:hypothetical protein